MRTVNVALGLLFLMVVCGYGQGINSGYYASPLDIPLFLSGNFAELRGEHFHGGIDLKTQQVIGKNVLAAANGYVSRLKVQTGGYGKSLYITHPNGTVTVYGHLDRFRPDINQYVVEQQYRQKSFAIDLYLPKDKFPVLQGEMVALSGNTGSSGGPHVHFEIRRELDQTPLNCLKYGFDITDNIAPILSKLVVYPLTDTSRVSGRTTKLIYRPVRVNGTHIINNNHPVDVYGAIGVGIEAFDLLNGSSNRCGIYSIEMIVNDQQVYHQVMDEVPFDLTRYINAHIDYEEKVKSNSKIHKLYVLPNNRLNIYTVGADRGVLIIPADSAVNVIVKVSDVAGNLSKVNFVLRGSDFSNSPMALPVVVPGIYYRYDKEVRVSTNQYEVAIPAYSLYDDTKLDFQWSDAPATLGTYSKALLAGRPTIPLHLPAKISIRDHTVPPSLRTKALLANISESGKVMSAQGQAEGPVITCETRKLGMYVVMVDTVAPRITPINITRGKNMKGTGSIRFRIRDDLSGIESYQGYIDHQWVLMEYDPKNELLFYEIDPTRIAKQPNHLMELFVTDTKGNTASFKTSFLY